MRDDNFDGFDWSAWAEDDAVGAHGGNGRHDGPAGALRGGGAGFTRSEEDSAADNADAAPGGWVTTGGVVHWEEPDDATDDPQKEAQSPLAADELDLPLGAPDAPRVRAVHAWIIRQRAARYETMGALLLQQREQHADEDTAERPGRRRPHRGTEESAPLELAIAEHQAAADEYDALLETLDDFGAHSGAGRVLVEYYLWLAEHLATLAAAPEAATAASTAHSLAEAAWRGRAHAAIGVRGRVERVTAPAPEE